MSEIRHSTADVNGIRMHYAECGEGPVVLFCHGFPESWYSWRHQLPALAEAGYRAIAPDMRGYGQTDAPESIDAYTMLNHVGDMVALLDHLRADDAVIVGHDWGAPVAWESATLRPDRFRAVCGMSVPRGPRIPMRPTEMMAAMAGDRFMYILYFQEPGVAEAELEADVERTMRMFLYSASGSIPKGSWKLDIPKTAGFLDAMQDCETLPDWLSEADLAYYVGEFKRTGFRGGLSWYRAIDRGWELMAAFQGVKLRVPALFIGGLRDGVVTGPEQNGPSPMVLAMPQTCEDLRGTVLIEGKGHWVQQEAPEETNAALIDFLREIDGR